MVQIAPGAQGSGPPTPCLVPCALLLCAVLAAPAGLAPSARHVLAERPPPTHKLRVAGPAAPSLPRGHSAAVPGAATPAPTPVLPLGDRSRRYQSSLAPYSVVTTWPGKAAVWPDGRWDQFDRDGRIMEIEGDRAVPGATTAQAVRELMAYLRTTRMMELHLLGPVHVAGEQCPSSSHAIAIIGSHGSGSWPAGVCGWSVWTLTGGTAMLFSPTFSPWRAASSWIGQRPEGGGAPPQREDRKGP